MASTKKELPVHAASLTEQWDTDVVRRICALKNIDVDLYKGLQHCLKEELCKDRKNTAYHYGAKTASSRRDWGRAYSSSMSLQSMPRWCKRLVGHFYQHDIDIENAMFILLQGLCKKYKLKTPQLDEYCENREYYLSLGDRKAMKQLFIQLANGGNAYYPVKEIKQFVDDFKKEMVEITNTFYQMDDFQSIREMAAKEVGTTDPLAVQKYFFYLFNSKIESQVIDVILSVFRKKTQINVLVHDGFMIAKTEKTTRKLIRTLCQKAQKLVLDKFGFIISISEKSLEPTIEDLAKLDGPKDLEIMNPFTRGTYIITTHAKENHLARYEEGLYKQHDTIKGVYLERKDKGTPQDHINEFLKNDTLFLKGLNMPAINEWWKTTDHKDFPLITTNKCDHDLIAFRDGYFDIHTLALHSFDDIVKINDGKSPITFRYYDVNYNDTIHLETPAWNKIVQYQWEPAVIEIFEILIGRLHYAVGTYDQWEVIPYLVGLAGTGKSKIIECIIRMFFTGDIGTIDANSDKSFTLETLWNKKIILFPDAPKNIDEFLPATTLCSMASGENISISRKHKTKLNLDKWTATAFFSANYHFNYRDDAGRISRRLMALPMYNNILDQDKDLTLSKKLQSEAPAVLLRCLKKYRECTKSQTKSIWMFVPQTLLDMQEETKMKTNTVYRFLKENGGVYEFTFNANGYIKWKDFVNAYKNYCKFDLNIKYVHTDLDDLKTFINCGCQIKLVKFCQSCEKPANPDCCELYDTNKRTNIKCLVGVNMVNTKDNIKIIAETEEEPKPMRIKRI
jgi:phage/plasmid-associated DNA primase